MGGAINHPIPQNMPDWMRDIQRRLLTQERRSSKAEIGQALGPGIGKTAQRISDWNTEHTWLSGNYWSDIGSVNSPNPAKPWMGTTRTAGGVGGIQEVMAFDATMEQRLRTFTFTTDGIPVFSAWSAPTGGFTSNYTGGWPTAIPGPTTGSSMTLPAGTLRAICNVTAYQTVSGAIQVDAYFDGVNMGSMGQNGSTAVNQHLDMWPRVFTTTVTAGTHWIYFRQVAGTSDAGDVGSFYGTVLPA